MRDQNTADLTTGILEKLKGRETVSKQFVEDLVNSKYVKQVERDLIHKVLKDSSRIINVDDFSNNVKMHLLQLRLSNRNPDLLSNGAPHEYAGKIRDGWRLFGLPDNLKGNVKNYYENVYQSHIKTNAGSPHYGLSAPQYFGHTRVEDMADGNIRRIIELQSDLYQRGRIEQQTAYKLQIEVNKEYSEIEQEVAMLRHYTNPTAHYRMVREEIKQAAKDGKTRLQFPVGQTALRIEGLGDRNNWSYWVPGAMLPTPIIESDLVIGKEIDQAIRTGQKWVITNVLGGGKFKAVPRQMYEDAFEAGRGGMNRIVDANRGQTLRDFEEIFDISGKIDTQNPIYKFYEKDIGQYLKNNYSAALVTDKQGVTWYEITLTPEMATQPVLAFDSADRKRFRDEVKTHRKKDMEKQKKKELNKRLENFNKVLESQCSVEAPYPEKEKTGLKGFIEAFERPLRENQLRRKGDRTLDIDMGEDKDFDFEL